MEKSSCETIEGESEGEKAVCLLNYQSELEYEHRAALPEPLAVVRNDIPSLLAIRNRLAEMNEGELSEGDTPFHVYVPL